MLLSSWDGVAEHVLGRGSRGSSQASHSPASRCRRSTPDLLSATLGTVAIGGIWTGLAGGPFAARLAREVPHGA